LNNEFRESISKPVVRLEEIAALRAHLEKKYPDVSQEDRAEMLAQSIYKMMDAAMAGLEPKQKDRIRKRLIKQYLIESKQSVLKLDVLNQILHLPDILPDQIVSKTWGWYVMNTGHSIPMSEFINQVTPYLPPKVREIIRHQTESRQNREPASVQPEITVRKATVPPSENKASPASHARPKRRKYRIAKKYRITRKGLMAIVSVIAAVSLICIAASTLRFPALHIALPENHGMPSNFTLDLTSPFYSSEEIVGKPEYFQFHNPSVESLRKYLSGKNSALLQDGYLDHLLTYSQKVDINPLLLIAILGQEQSYVPSKHQFVKMMLKNPFNVYGSWETHGIGFDKSLAEACNTINTTLAQRKPHEDPFAVINHRYAQDPNWNIGVKLIFLDLEAKCSIE